MNTDNKFPTIIGKTKQQVMELFGTDVFPESEENILVYVVGKNLWNWRGNVLYIRFNAEGISDKVYCHKNEKWNFTHTGCAKRLVDFQNTDPEELIGLPVSEITARLGKPYSCSNEEWVYILRSRFFGLQKEKLHLYFYKDIVRDFYIGL